MVETQKKVEELKKTYLSWSLHDSDVRREGRREGRQEGIQEAKLENAQNLLTMKLGTHEQIAQAVGLPLETVQQLARFAEAQPTD